MSVMRLEPLGAKGLPGGMAAETTPCYRSPRHGASPNCPYFYTEVMVISATGVPDTLPSFPPACDRLGDSDTSTAPHEGIEDAQVYSALEEFGNTIFARFSRHEEHGLLLRGLNVIVRPLVGAIQSGQQPLREYCRRNDDARILRGQAQAPTGARFAIAESRISRGGGT